MKKKESKADATKMARELLQLAITNSASNLDLAKKQAALARRLLLKFNIRLDGKLRRYYCRGCKQLIVPGLNARVRLGHGATVIHVTCDGCGFVNRKIVQNQGRLKYPEVRATSSPTESENGPRS